MAYSKEEFYSEEATNAMMAHYKGIIEAVGEDPNREGLQKTPERIAKAMQYVTAGYHMDAHAI